MVAKRRNRGGWTAARQAHLQLALDVFEELRDYLPLTLRQVYYQLVAKELIANGQPAYKKLSGILAQARIEGRVPWECMEDRTRSILRSGGWTDASAFQASACDQFLRGYRRDLLTGQPWVPEIWIEKDALSRICHEPAFPYCVSVIVAKGYGSVSYVHECRKRAQRAIANGSQGLRILYFGDLDPSGWNMLPAMLETLQAEMKLGDCLQGVRCGLTPEQVELYELPHSWEAIKEKDSRTPGYRRWLREQGIEQDLAVEIDALPPATLEGMVRNAIEENLDLDLFESQQEIEEEERDELDGYRQVALAALDDAEGEP